MDDFSMRSLGLIPTPAQPGAGISNGAVFTPQALVHSRIHPPAGAGSTGAAQPVPAGIPANVTPSPPPVNVATPENPLAASAPGDQVGILLQGAKRRKTQQPQRARDPADPPAVPAPPASRTLPAIPNGRQPVPGLRSVPAPDPVLVPAPDPAPIPSPVPDPAPHIPVPTWRWDPAGDGIPPAASRRSVERATRQPSPDEDPTNTDAFFSMNPAERCKALVQRNDRLEDRLERAHTELETERAARVQLESALAETRLKLLVSRRAERRAIGAIRDGVRAFANGAGERDGGSGRLLSVDAVRAALSDGETTFTALCALAIAPASTPRSVSTERPRLPQGAKPRVTGPPPDDPGVGRKMYSLTTGTYEDGAGEVARRPGAVAREAIEKSFAPARRPGRPSGSGRGAGGRGRGRGRGRSRKRGFGSEEELDVESSFSEESEEEEEEAHRFERDASALDPEAAAFATGETALRGERVMTALGAAYFANEDDTPLAIGRALRVSGNQIVALNGWHLPGLKLRSKLREGTRLWLEPATDEERDAMREELIGRCKKVLDALNRHRFAHIFAEPVDPAALNIPDYPEVIPNPMDLGTVGRKLERGEYAHFRDFQADCELTFQNCVRYNPAGTDAHTMGDAMLKELEKKWVELGFC